MDYRVAVWPRLGATIQYPASGTSKQVRGRKLFEPMQNLWGAADSQPVCTACPFGFPADGRSQTSRAPRGRRNGKRTGQESL